MSRSFVGANLLGVAVVVGLVIALVTATGSDRSPTTRPPGPAPAAAVPSAAVPSAPTSPVASVDLAGPRAAAALEACPSSGSGPAGGPLAGLSVECLADGRPLDVGAALAGKPALLDVWAWNCAPCAEELPALQSYAARVGPELTVLTVHSNPATGNGLERLAAFGVHLPGVADPTSRIAALAGAPAVVPVTILLRADGSVAKVLAKPYTDPAAIAADVQRYLGVRA